VKDILLNVKNLKTFLFTEEGVVKAVDEVNLFIKRGEIVGLAGESGCGKSMTAYSILRLVPNPPGKIIGGEIIFKGKNLLKITESEKRYQ
jgi:ABC-type dipeptide/oligopeptide/nickel transport system ATPase component